MQATPPAMFFLRPHTLQLPVAAQEFRSLLQTSLLMKLEILSGR